VSGAWRFKKSRIRWISSCVNGRSRSSPKNSSITYWMWLKLGPKVYRRVHNVILPARNGTTQIDHVVVSIYGLFVIETKNMDGWIFGSTQQETWTQQFFKKKFKFQNPLRQNYRHTRCLAEFLNLDHDFLHSVVFFIGNVENLDKGSPRKGNGATGS
jgi:restriction system protein